MTTPHNIHIRNRLTHSSEVTSLSTIIASILGLNVELTRAIALAHDIGHTPFGHDGERFIANVSGKHFTHEVMGVVIAQHVERCGVGLNLTHEVLRGIIRDACSDEICGGPLSPESEVVMWADRFAYITGDFNDFSRIGYTPCRKLTRLIRQLGNIQRERTNNLIGALCYESARAGKVTFGESEFAEIFLEIKTLMYQVYGTLNASNGPEVLERTYDFIERVKLGIDPALVLALMTDRDVLYLAQQPVLDYSSLKYLTVWELIPTLRKRRINWWDPDLRW